MPAVVLPTHHCIAATNSTTTKSPSAAAVTIAAATTAGNNFTITTTLYWLPVVDSPACCFCCYCGDRLFVVADTTAINGSIGSSSISCFDACLPPSRNFNRLCQCDGAVTATAAVVLLVPYVLRCFRPIVLPPAFVAAANYIRHHRRIYYHHLYNTAFVGNNMETR